MKRVIVLLLIVIMVASLAGMVLAHPHGGPPGQAKERVHPLGGPPGQDPETNRPPGWDKGEKSGWVILVDQCEMCEFVEGLSEEELVLFLEENELTQEELDELQEELCECVYEDINMPPGLFRRLNRS